MSRRKPVLAAVATAAALLLAGCAIPLPEPSPEPAPTEPLPALDTVRVDRVLEDLGSVLEEGDSARDPDLLEPRLAGAALESRRLEYRLADATADTDNSTEPRRLPTDLAAPPVVSVSEGWPRTVATIAQIADGDNTAVLMMLQQDGPRDAYRLVGWVQLLPGVTSPEMALPDVGSTPLAPDADGLKLAPTAVLDAYANLLQEQGDSEFAQDTFADDDFRSALFADREQIQTGVEDAGEYGESVARIDEDPVTLQTADGGALVFGSLRSAQTYERTVEDSEMTVATPSLVALAGSDGPIEVDSTLTADYRIMVAFYVPPADSDQPVTVLGVERALASVRSR